MCVALTCARIHCLNCDAWDSGIAMIFRSHRPDRDSTPCFSLEQASMSKSQHGLVGAELNARARGRKGLCHLRDDSRKALDCPYNCRMKILIPVMLIAVAVLACSGERGPQPTAPEQAAPERAVTIVLAPALSGPHSSRPWVAGLRSLLRHEHLLN